jgi:hypothetical protein
MKKALKRKWVKALRGESKQGVYTQGYDSLVVYSRKYKTYNFCPLGVLINECNVKGNRWYKPYRRIIKLLDCDKATSLEAKIVKMNDLDVMSFSAIADWIEKNIPES